MYDFRYAGVTAALLNMTELAEHVTWQAGLPVLTQLFPSLTHYSRNYACAQSYRLFSKLCRHNRRTPTHDILAKQSEVDNYSY